MHSIEIVANGTYLPKYKVESEELNRKFKLEENWIEKRTGITTRYEAKEEAIEEMAIKAIQIVLEKTKIEKEKIGQIIVATTSSKLLMPGISFKIQKALEIKSCMCMDILAGCSGYINAFDCIYRNIAMRRNRIWDCGRS